eukprot:Pgem_evm1s9413
MLNKSRLLTINLLKQQKLLQQQQHHQQQLLLSCSFFHTSRISKAKSDWEWEKFKESEEERQAHANILKARLKEAKIPETPEDILKLRSTLEKCE